MYRKGFVSSKTYNKLVIRIYGESGGLVIVDANDSAAVVPDIVPDPASLTAGRTVIATCDTFFWEAGNIVEIKKLDETGQYIYRVRFISGGDTWVYNVNYIRILMTRKDKGVCSTDNHRCVTCLCHCKVRETRPSPYFFLV